MSLATADFSLNRSGLQVSLNQNDPASVPTRRQQSDHAHREAVAPCRSRIFYSLVVFKNLTDFTSNYQLVRHVLMMDTTFPGNHGMWRALTSSAAGHSFYIAIIVWEIVTAILLWWGCLALSRPSGARA